MPDRQRLLELALKGLEADRARIDNEIAEIKIELNSRRAPATASAPAGAGGGRSPGKKKRTMSEEAKRKISEAMKRRYAIKRKAANK